jgi:hypothetical protein
MLYRIHRIFLDFFHRPVFQKKKHDLSETGFLPQVKMGEKTPTQLGPLERANEIQFPKRRVFFGIQDDGKSQDKFSELYTSKWPVASKTNKF